MRQVERRILLVLWFGGLVFWAAVAGLACAPAIARDVETPEAIAEDSDSGWAVGKPAVASGEEKPAAKIVFGKVSKKSQAAPREEPSESTPDEPRVAARSRSGGPWRPARTKSDASESETTPAPPQPTQESPSFLLPEDSDEAEAADDSNEPQETPSKETDEDTPSATVEVSDSDVEILEGDEPEEVETLPPLTRQMKALRSKLRHVLKGYYRRPLNSRDNDPWEVMHGMLAFGIHSRIRQGGPRGVPITAVGWLCYNRPCKWTTLMYVTKEDELRAKYGVSLQGHMGQFLAMLAQCKVSPDYPVRVDKHDLTVQDLIQAEMDTCYPKHELTFKLIALMHYLDSDTTWINDQGQEWSISRLIHEELEQPIRGAACGGTHRLGGLSLAARTRVSRGEPLDGEFARAAEYVKKYHEYAFRFQNRDGSLSTNWFRGRGDERDIDRRVKTTGHTLEWLCYSLDDDELRDWRTFRAVYYLTNLLYSNYNHEWEVGPVSHALHALILYDERVFQPYDDKLEVAGQNGRRSAARDSSLPAWMR